MKFFVILTCIGLMGCASKHTGHLSTSKYNFHPKSMLLTLNISKEQDSGAKTFFIKAIHLQEEKAKEKYKRPFMIDGDLKCVFLDSNKTKIIGFGIANPLEKIINNQGGKVKLEVGESDFQLKIPFHPYYRFLKIFEFRNQSLVEIKTLPLNY